MGLVMPENLITQALLQLSEHHDLSREQASEVLAAVMRGEATETQIAGFLMALRAKGETVDELAGLAETMRSFASHVTASSERLLDTAGTGGGASTFNVSTTAAFIAAGAGCAVAKHGNRSYTSRCGSADLLEALGARIDLDGADVAHCIDVVGFGFMFAPAHHSATRFVVPVRKALGVPTAFNLLGPLTNPAGARHQLIGVADPERLELMAGALARLGTTRALVVSSFDGLDEISTAAPTHVVEVNGDEISRYTLRPQAVGISEALHLPMGGDPADNAAMTRLILEGEGGVASDLALINAGAAIYAAEGVESIADGVALARQVLFEGRAHQVLEDYIATSTSFLAP